MDLLLGESMNRELSERKRCFRFGDESGGNGGDFLRREQSRVLFELEGFGLRCFSLEGDLGLLLGYLRQGICMLRGCGLKRGLDH